MMPNTPESRRSETTSGQVVTAASTAPTWNIPNLITLSRLILTFVILILISLEWWWLGTTVLFVIAVATDFFDGYLARKWNQVTTLGRIMDPFVDKIIIGGSMIFLTAIPASGVTAWMTFTVIAREILITALRSVLEGQGVDFSAKWSGKLKMVLQSVVIPFALLSLSPWFQSQLGNSWEAFLFTRDLLLWIMVAVTVYSGIEYISRGARILRAQA